LKNLADGKDYLARYKDTARLSVNDNTDKLEVNMKIGSRMARFIVSLILANL
jgi:hypothetical protein